MKKSFLLAGLVCSLFSEVLAQTPTKYWVKLTDKNSSPYSISNPSAFLTPRAISRRAAQNIPIDQYDIPVNPSYVSQIQALGDTVLYTSHWLNAVVIKTSSSTVLNAVNALPFVQSTNPVAKHKRSADPIDNGDPDIDYAMKTSAVNSTYSYGGSLNQIQMLNGVCMHDMGYDGKNMQIAVLDAGFLHVDSLKAFDSLWVNHQIIGTRDFVTGDTMVFEDFHHGASVLSCMGGNTPGQLVGTAPRSKFWLLRTEDADSELIIEEDNWVRGVEFADSVGVDVVNSSLGYTTFDATTSSQDHVYTDLNGHVSNCSIAATMAARKGMIICNSAGNDGNLSWHYISVPADADSILTVGSVNSTGIYSSFSSVGPTADGRIKPDVAAKGSSATIASGFSNAIITSSGTSFSSPILAGMVSCLWQANPTKKNMEIINAVKKSASQYQAPDNNLGYGIPNFCLADSILKGLLKIEVYVKDDVIMLSPNPFTDNLSFVYVPTSNQDITYEIYDIRGSLLMSEKRSVKQNTSLQFNITGLDALAKGIYLFVAKTSSSRFTKKIIKD